MNSKTSLNVIVVCMTVVICFGMAAMVAAFVAVPEGANIGTIISVLSGSVATAIAAIAALVKVNQIHETAKVTESNTDKILNGTMDEKLANVMRSVLAERDTPPDAVS